MEIRPRSMSQRSELERFLLSQLLSETRRTM